MSSSPAPSAPSARMSAERKRLVALMYSREQEQVQQWIESITGVVLADVAKAKNSEESSNGGVTTVQHGLGLASPAKAAASHKERFAQMLFDALKDGEVLCQLVNLICPGVVGRIYTSEALFYRSYENTQSFLQACEKLGMPNEDLFDWTDLVKCSNFRRVVQSIDKLRSLVINGIVVNGNSAARLLRRTQSSVQAVSSKPSCPPIRHSCIDEEKDEEELAADLNVLQSFGSPSAVMMNRAPNPGAPGSVRRTTASMFAPSPANNSNAPPCVNILRMPHAFSTTASLDLLGMMNRGASSSTSSSSSVAHASTTSSPSSVAKAINPFSSPVILRTGPPSTLNLPEMSPSRRSARNAARNDAVSFAPSVATEPFDAQREKDKYIAELREKTHNFSAAISSSAAVASGVVTSVAKTDDLAEERKRREFAELKVRELQELVKQFEEKKSKMREKQLQMQQAKAVLKKTIAEPIQKVNRVYKSFSAGLRDVLGAMASDMKGTFQALSEAFKEHNKGLMGRYIAEQHECKKLLNKVIELQGNIRVFCRVRPLNDRERKKGIDSAVECPGENELRIRLPGVGSLPKKFQFDRVFDENSDQATTFEDVAPLVKSSVDGYNVCIFAYGQTGSGKTFTMEGPANNRGVNFRALDELFRTIAQREEEFDYRVSISVVEIYNEMPRDLLMAPEEYRQQKKMEIRQNASGVYIPDLTEVTVTDSAQVVDLVFNRAYVNRQVGSTNTNEHSSRSHCLLFVNVVGIRRASLEKTIGKLILIDLAGSERIEKSKAEGDRLKEAQHINKSLSALGNVIAALQSKTPHIPYRDSKLTYLLQDCLGGSSKCLMFCQISPSEDDYQESLCSLQFAQRVGSVMLGAAKKTVENADALKFKQIATRAIEEARTREDAVGELQEKVASLEDAVKGKMDIIGRLQKKLQEKEKELTESKEEKNELQAQLKSKERLMQEVQKQARQPTPFLQAAMMQQPPTTRSRAAGASSTATFSSSAAPLAPVTFSALSECSNPASTPRGDRADTDSENLSPESRSARYKRKAAEPSLPAFASSFSLPVAAADEDTAEQPAKSARIRTPTQLSNALRTPKAKHQTPKGARRQADITAAINLRRTRIEMEENREADDFDRENNTRLLNSFEEAEDESMGKNAALMKKRVRFGDSDASNKEKGLKEAAQPPVQVPLTSLQAQAAGQRHTRSRSVLATAKLTLGKPTRRTDPAQWGRGNMY